MRLSVVRVALVLSFLFVTHALYAQYSGTIRGTVTDPSGALVPGADVTVTNTATGASRTAKTNESGEYTVPNLPAGVYEVRVKAGNFKEFVAKGVELHVSSTAISDAKLAMGTASEQVTVEAGVLQVQTDSAQLGEVITNTQVRELPLNGRSMGQLPLLAPGVSARDGLDTRNKGLLSGVDFSINGNPVTNNLWLVDGANNNDLGSNRTILIYPSIDAISEFKMLRNSYGPEYGQASGGIVSIITKNGTNDFHGGVYYFGRNDALNSTEFFAKQGGKGKDVLRRNDYGYFVGGPIKKDKLFFFWSQEWNKEKRGGTRSACVPTAAERAGDFTTPSCGMAIPHAPGNAGTPMPVLSALDPAGVLLADLLPLPNTTPSGGSNKNWFQSLNSSVDWRQENIRVDYNLTNKHTATFRYTQDTWSNPSPTTQPIYWGDDLFPAVEGNWSQPSKSIIGKVTSILSNTITNEVQFSYSNNRIFATLGGTGSEGDPTGASYTPSELVTALEAGIPTIFPESTFPKKAGAMPPDAAWGGFGNYGDGQSLWLIAPWENSSDLYQFRDDLAKVYSSHTFKLGFFYSYNGKNEPAEGGHDRPSFGISGQGGTDTGNALADALNPGTLFDMGENSANLFPHGRWRDIEWYFQDNWKLRRNLTVEYGFRWSFLRQPYELDDQIASFNPAFYNPSGAAGDACNGLVVVPGTDPCGDANAKFGTNFSSGTPGVNRALVENGTHNIAPRLGISWDPWSNGKTAIRAGVGQFYQRERVSTVTALLGQNAPFSLSFSQRRTLDTALPLGVAGGSPSGARDPRPQLPNSWQWNVSVERELFKDTAFELGYVGNRGLHLTNDFDLNTVLPGNRLQAAFAGPGSFRPLSLFGGIQEFSHSGTSNYHALQALFRTRMKNVQLQAAYTWSHTISDVDLSDSSGNGYGTHTTSDPLNLGADRGNSEINRPHIFVTNAVFFLPTLNGSQPVVKHTLGGWELSAIVTAESGNSVFVRGPGQNVHYQFNDASCTSPGTNGFCTGNIADLTGTGLATEGSGNPTRLIATGTNCTSGQNGFQIFNPAAFTLVGYQIGTIQGSGRGNCLGPKEVNFDLSIHKNWKITERVGIQFRFDAFNAFNHSQFLSGSITTGWLNGNVECGSGPVFAPCSPTNNVITALVPPSGQSSFIQSNFGQAKQTRGGRDMQYGLKITF